MECFVPLELEAGLLGNATPELARNVAVCTWPVLCFFVARPHRGRGISHALLAGAVKCARRQGAKVIEGYPFNTAGVGATHHGHSRIFFSDTLSARHEALAPYAAQSVSLRANTLSVELTQLAPPVNSRLGPARRASKKMRARLKHRIRPKLRLLDGRESDPLERTRPCERSP